jgi:hypothetical protein
MKARDLAAAILALPQAQQELEVVAMEEIWAYAVSEPRLTYLDGARFRVFQTDQVFQFDGPPSHRRSAGTRDDPPARLRSAAEQRAPGPFD